jgi:hypothetical protein
MLAHLSNKRLSAITAILLLCIALSGCGQAAQNTASSTQKTGQPVNSTPVPCTQSNCHGIRPFIDTWNNIHLEQVFSYNINNPATIAKYYDFVWGADQNQLAAFRAGNPNIMLSYYMPFHRDSGTFTNMDLGKSHDLAYWKNLHPDWILYQCDRTTPAYEDNDPNMPLAFANPALVDWQVQTYAQPASEAGYDALAADNVNLENLYGACGYYQNGKWVQRYTGQSDDPQWRADVVSWATRMQNALHALKHPLALIINFGLGSISPNDQYVQQLIHHTDGILDEGGFTNYGNGYITDNNWVQLVNLIKEVQSLKKPYYTIDEFSTKNLSHDQIQWALSSYLMAKEHLATVFISSNQQYGSDLRYPEYNANLGTPEGEMYKDQLVYWRKYSNGLVVVNPSSSSSYSIQLNGSYVDSYGNHPGKSLTLQPHSGMLLLNS